MSYTISRCLLTFLIIPSSHRPASLHGRRGDVVLISSCLPAFSSDENIVCQSVLCVLVGSCGFFRLRRRHLIGHLIRPPSALMRVFELVKTAHGIIYSLPVACPISSSHLRSSHQSLCYAPSDENGGTRDDDETKKNEPPLETRNGSQNETSLYD